MDIATDKVAENLRELAGDVKAGKYGPDTNFNEQSFLDDLDEKIVSPLDGEIIS